MNNKEETEVRGDLSDQIKEAVGDRNLGRVLPADRPYTPHWTDLLEEEQGGGC